MSIAAASQNILVLRRCNCNALKAQSISEQHCDHFNAEEVGRSNRAPMGFQKRLPRHSPPSGRIDPVFEEDSLDRVPPNLVPQVVERSSDSGVTPTRIHTSHRQDQILDIDRGLRSARSSALARVKLSRDQLSLPSEESIRGHQGLDSEEPFSADFLGLRREPSTLRIREGESFPAQLLPQRSVTRKLRFLLLEVFDHILLMAIHPAGEDQHQELKRQRVNRSQFRPAELDEVARKQRLSDRLRGRIFGCFASADFWHTTRMPDDEAKRIRARHRGPSAPRW